MPGLSPPLVITAIAFNTLIPPLKSLKIEILRRYFKKFSKNCKAEIETPLLEF